MKYEWTLKYDKLSYGLIAGIIFPVIGFFIAYLIKGGETSISSFWFMFIKDVGPSQFYIDELSNNRKDILTICLICNMLLFYLPFFHWKMDQFSKCIVGSTVFLAALSFIYIF